MAKPGIAKLFANNHVYVATMLIVIAKYTRQKAGFAMTDRARPIPSALATANGIGHAMRSGFAEQNR